GTLTVGSATIIRTGVRGGTVGDAGSSFINNGTISAQSAGRTLTINAGNFTNAGTLEALNGATLMLAGSFANPPSGILSGGFFHAGANSTLALSAGSILTNNTTVFLDGIGSSFAPIDGLTTTNGNFLI